MAEAQRVIVPAGGSGIGRASAGRFAAAGRRGEDPVPPPATTLAAMPLGVWLLVDLTAP